MNGSSSKLTNGIKYLNDYIVSHSYVIWQHLLKNVERWGSKISSYLLGWHMFFKVAADLLY